MRDEHSNGHAEIAALAQQVATARGKLPLQYDNALLEVLSDSEVAAERELAEWIRAQRRGQRRRAVQAELAAEKRDRRAEAALRRADESDARWHRKALAARRRVASRDARIAQLYQRAEWSSRALIAVVVLGMVWAGVNVQRNLVPSGDMSDPLYWLSYGIEAMISIPIIVIMVAATTAARWGRELPRGRVVLIELLLLGTTIGLNAGPHLAAGDFGRAAEFSVAPIMVGVVIWLHAWVSARYAQLIDEASSVSAEAPSSLPAARAELEEVASAPLLGVPAPRGNERADYPGPRTSVPVEYVAPPMPLADAPSPPATEHPGVARPVPQPHPEVTPHPATAPQPELTGAEQAATQPDHAEVTPYPAAIPQAEPAAPQPHSAGAAAHSTSPRRTSRTEPVSAAIHREPDHPRPDDTPDPLAPPAHFAKPVTVGPVTTPDAREHLRATDPGPAAPDDSTNSQDEPAEKPTPATTAPPATPVQAPNSTDEDDLPPTAAHGRPQPAHLRAVTPAAEHSAAGEPAAAELVPAAAPIDIDAPLPDHDPVLESDEAGAWAAAKTIVARGWSKVPVEQLAEILEMADRARTPASIGAEMGLPRSVVDQAVQAARKLSRTYAMTS